MTRLWISLGHSGSFRFGACSVSLESKFRGILLEQESRLRIESSLTHISMFLRYL